MVGGVGRGCPLSVSRGEVLAADDLGELCDSQEEGQ